MNMSRANRRASFSASICPGNRSPGGNPDANPVVKKEMGTPFFASVVIGRFLNSPSCGQRSPTGLMFSSRCAAATLSTVVPRLECSRPITATVSFALRPTMSMFRSAITFASGTVGWSAK